MATRSEDVPISQPITGTHLQPENLSHKIQAELARIGDWAANEKFVPMTKEIHRYGGDEDGARRVDTILRALNYKVCHPS